MFTNCLPQPVSSICRFVLFWFSFFSQNAILNMKWENIGRVRQIISKCCSLELEISTPYHYVNWSWRELGEQQQHRHYHRPQLAALEWIENNKKIDFWSIHRIWTPNSSIRKTQTFFAATTLCVCNFKTNRSSLRCSQLIWFENA